MRSRDDAQDLAALQCRRQGRWAVLVGGDGSPKAGQRGCRMGLFRPQRAELRLLRGCSEIWPYTWLIWALIELTSGPAWLIC